MPDDSDSNDNSQNLTDDGFVRLSQAEQIGRDIAGNIAGDDAKLAGQVLGTGIAKAVAGAIELFASGKVFDLDD